MSQAPAPEPQSTTELPAGNVIEALRRVMRDLPAIGKEGRASQAQGGYAYRGIEDITKVAQSLLARHGVVFVPRVVRTTIEQITVQNKPWTDTILDVEYDVYGPGGIEDKITVGPLIGIGRDNSDKGANKAETQAYKYALVQVFCIADQTSDADGTTHEADAYEAGQPRRTPAGNLRQGPRLLEGWSTVSEQRDAHDELRELSQQLDAEQKADMTAWRKANDYEGWPLPLEQFTLVHARVRALVDGWEDDGDPIPVETGPSAPAEAVENDGGVVPAASPVQPATDEPGPVSEDVPTADQAQSQLDAANRVLERRSKFEAHVKGLAPKDVREQLRVAQLDDQGGAPVVRERLVEHLLAQAAIADKAAG